MRFEYQVIVSNEGDEFIAESLDFPEAVTGGSSYNEALAEIKDALEEAIAGRIHRKEDIPEPTKGEDGIKIAISSQIAMKALLYLSLRKKKINNVQFAKMLSCDEKEVRRLIDPLHNSKLKKLNAALEVLGVNIVIDTQDAIYNIESQNFDKEEQGINEALENNRLCINSKPTYKA